MHGAWMLLCHSCTAGASRIIVGGATGTVTTEQELVHREHFIWDNCSNLQSGYKGVINTTCYLGELVVDGGSCVPQPCQEDVREVVVAGLAVTVRLTGTLLGTTSPAPHGFEGTGDCSQLDVNLVGSFSVGCTASEFNLDLGQCVLNTCEPPSTAIASLGDTTQSGSLVLDETHEHTCPNVSVVTGYECEVSCIRGYGGENTSLRCWAGVLQPVSGALNDCEKLPLIVKVTGTLDLQVSDPQAFVRDEDAVQGTKTALARTFGVNESLINVTLKVVSINVTSNATEDENSTGERRLSFLEQAVIFPARRLAMLVVRVLFTILQEVESEDAIEQRGNELMEALSNASDEQLAQTLVEAIAEVSGGNSTYEVTVVDRQANVTVLFGDRDYSGDFNITIPPVVEDPPPDDDDGGLSLTTTGLILGVVAGIIALFVGGLCVGCLVGRCVAKRAKRQTEHFIFSDSPPQPDVEIPEDNNQQNVFLDDDAFDSATFRDDPVPPDSPPAQPEQARNRVVEFESFEETNAAEPEAASRSRASEGEGPAAPSQATRSRQSYDSSAFPIMEQAPSEPEPLMVSTV